MIANLICAVVLAAVLMRWLPARLPRVTRSVLAVVLLVATVLPFPYGIAGWLLAIISEFSVTSAALALAGLACRINSVQLIPVTELRALCRVVVVVALVFYPVSLGATHFDLYALGYGDFRLSTALLLVGLFAWVSRAYASCLVLVLAQGAYAVHALGSDNLWDYLIDPWLVFWCSGWLLRDAVKRRRAHLPA